MAGKVGRDAQEVMLQTNGLTRLPTVIGPGGWWRDVQFLCVSANALALLPAEVGGLTKLQELNLNDNHLESLPSELFSGCTQLSILHLNNNRLRALPSTIGNCQALKVHSNIYNARTAAHAHAHACTDMRTDSACEWK
jgi:Leucine-rich repeat (LRR) protein